jgi:hypothetical protein
VGASTSNMPMGFYSLIHGYNNILNYFSKCDDCPQSTYCIHQILEKKWEYNETAHHLFVDFKTAYD